MQRAVGVRLNPYAQCVKDALKRCSVFRCCCCCCGGGSGSGDGGGGGGLLF